ncbi:MAG: ATP-binding protein [Chitinivibrionales bacterium]|nr:ATP-binding protein [Chitinivibrionales bacterium]MBD3356567.1 ATP-binding protein [Chitinivibrionales bacterium]
MHATLSDSLLDLIQNAHEAGAHSIIVTIKQRSSHMEFSIADDGCGMESEVLARISDPFSSDSAKHASRRFGLGLPFLKQGIEQCAGTFDIRSEPGVGTSICFALDSNHIDAPPVGNLVSTIVSALCMCDSAELVCVRSYENRSYTLRRSELVEVLGDLATTESLCAIRTFISNAEENLSSGET